ncbi:MAG: hypothetical protein C0624_04730 [Desulfuromonas sp.]|nr:MAG: hypothetical protein C0624_04730 [Desulfuromonas sp.]
MQQPPEIFQQIYARHGHRCPMSTLGGRMGLAAMKALGPQPAERLEAHYAHDTCAIDGIELTTGCSRANKRLTVAQTGAHVLSLNVGAHGVVVTLRDAALAIAWRYRKVDEELEQARGKRSLEELEGLLHLRSEVLQEVLEKFWTLPDDELLRVEVVDA